MADFELVDPSCFLGLPPDVRLQMIYGAIFNGGSGPRVATPEFSPVAGEYSTEQNVTITSSTAGASIYYTTDGSTPDVTDTLYTGPIVVVAGTTTIKAKGFKLGYSNSSVASGTFTIEGAGGSVFAGSENDYAGSETIYAGSGL